MTKPGTSWVECVALGPRQRLSLAVMQGLECQAFAVAEAGYELDSGREQEQSSQAKQRQRPSDLQPLAVKGSARHSLLPLDEPVAAAALIHQIALLWASGKDALPCDVLS